MPKVELFNKEEALDKALHLFWEKGYNGTSIRDLEQNTGIGKSSIYNTFGDKESLFFETLKQYLNKGNTLKSSSLINSESPLQAIKAIFEGICHSSVKDKEHKGCFLVNCTTELANHNSRAREFATDNKNAVIHLLKDLVLKAQRKGEISRAKDAGGIAVYLFSAMQGLRVTSMLTRNKKELQSVVDNTLYILS